MSQRAMSFLVLNLGCEMLYVIDQRLTAQQVAPDKARRVLTDVTSILVNERLLDEIFTNQPLGSHKGVRELLQDIASASIMRLDHYSMSKLWDLMTMVFKWQITVSGPADLCAITERHLREVAALHPYPDGTCKSILDNARSRLHIACKNITIEDLTSIQSILLLWLNNCRSKISLLLRMGVQNKDASFAPRSSLTHEIIDNLGCNIYKRFGKTYGVINTNDYNADTSEVTFLVSQITGISGDLDSITPIKEKSDTPEQGNSQDEIQDDEADLSKCVRQIIKKRDFETIELNTLVPKSLQDDLLDLIDRQEII